MVSRPPDRPSARVRRHRLVAGGVGLVFVVALLIGAVGGGGGLPAPPAEQVAAAARDGNPFLYAASRQRAFANRAAAGSAWVVFTKSPGGVLATAARVAHYRRVIDAAVRGTSISPALVEGIVFLESAGRSDVIAGSDPADAAGLTQILAQTGQSLLGMHINLARSRRLTRQIDNAASADELGRVARLQRQREAIDDRFNPAKELAATVRYLQIALRDLGGHLDLAVAAYHGGIGNVQDVLRDYDGGQPVPYVQLYFDSTPNLHRAAWALLSRLGDDSSLYYWRVLAAEEIMSLYRSDRVALAHLSRLETGYPSNALALVPPARTTSFSDPAALAGAYAAHTIVPLPRNAAALHLAYSAGMGGLARRLGAPRALYSGLRPAARAMLIEIAALVHRLSGSPTPLTVASTVLDARYDRLLGFDDPPATTGFTFQIERRYGSGSEAQAFQFVLDRLQSLNLIAWLRGSSTIEITVAPDALSVLHAGV